MVKTEDQTEPVSEAEVVSAIREADDDKLFQLVDKVLAAINEKRDSYNGVVSSIIYLIDSRHDRALSRLQGGIQDYLIQRPMSFAGKTFLTKALYRLISDQPCFIEDFFEHIIATTDSWEAKILPETSQVLKIHIIALKAIKQAENSKLGRPTSLSPELIDRLCMNAILNGDEATKIDTLSLILESRSTTKILEANELSIFMNIFLDAICLQDAALRQAFIALTNKVLKRLIDSYRVVMRDKKKFDEEDRAEITKRYREFIEWLIETCLDSNYCNAYFGSFVLTISTLKLIILHVTFSEEGLPLEPLLKSRRCYDSILSCLGDSFEENKVLALSLLLSLPYNDDFFSEDNIHIFQSIAYDLIDSINPAHSLTCQYVFKLLIGMEEKKAIHTGCKETSKNRILLKHLNTLLDQMDGIINDVEDNFTVALKGKPVYPKLTCIRSLLEEASIEDLESDRQKWLELCHRIVSISIEACRAVSTIVCNLNPETIGHLPMDLKPVDPESLAKSFNLSVSISNSEYSTITSQMLLISGWKTIKECSLSLGTLCTRFWWPKGGIKMKKEKFPGLSTQPVLAREDIFKILDYFDHYLRNLRHRGAFEQAYNGFIMVTRRIWHDEDFRELLVRSLHNIMDDFKTDNSIDEEKADCLKAYVTRRSAGLPFVVQAILISEHKQESQHLDWIMGSLFNVLESVNSEEYQRIHCMNILKALIKEHNLGEKVLKHVGKTLSITLKAFRAESFPIRNCANMLLKAVVDRTFGVNRLKDEIHRRNQLSFEKFFSDFPNLFTEMLDYLETDVSDKRYLPSIHSVLIVLSRLKASTSPSANYTFEEVIKPFIVPTMNWVVNCPDYKLREVAAKICIQLCNCSTVQIEPPVEIEELRKYLLENLDWSHSAARYNEAHGRLAALRFLIESDSLLFQQNEDAICNILDMKDCSIPPVLHNSSVALNYFSTYQSWSQVVRSVGNCRIPSLISTYTLQFRSDDQPHTEQALFKVISIILIEGFKRSCSSEQLPVCLRQANLACATLAFHKQRSLNLQAAVVRLLAQLYCRNDHIVDELHSALDLDSTAVYETLFDQLKHRKEEALECAKLEAYLSCCDGQKTWSAGQSQLRLLDIYTSLLNDFSKFPEFKPSKTSDDSKIHFFSVKSSNTPRSIELLAYACKTRGFEDFGKPIIWQHVNETWADKLRFIREFISNLTDCDAKSLAIILAGQMLERIPPNDMECVAEFGLFGSLINELADGDHSSVVRKASCHFLKSTFTNLFKWKPKVDSRSLVNYIGAIIKLTKDSDSEIRSLGFKIVSSLDDILLSQQQQQPRKSEKLDLCGSRLDPLIRLIVVDGTIFDPDNVEHSNELLELLCQIIFDHGKNHCYESNDDKERLFDKTKLNTFADHIAATRSALRGLYRFFQRKRQQHGGQLVELSSMRLPQDVLAELNCGLKLAKPSKSNATGDYSWRLKQLDSARQPMKETGSDISADQVIALFLKEISDSFQYFSRGYWNILTDTEYIYHELSLYRRLVFVKFVLDCMKPKLDHMRSLCEIREGLRDIVNKSCATTILTKCIELLDFDDQVTGRSD